MSVGPKVKYSSGASRLSQAAQGVAKDLFSVQMINLNYIDTGLFGFAVAANCTEIDKIVKEVVSKMREVAKNINENDLNTAK